jgi:hypothetical protein
VKFPAGCGGRSFQSRYVLTGMAELPTYDIDLCGSGCGLVTAGIPASPGQLTVGVTDMPEWPVKFPAGCGGRSFQSCYVLTEIAELPT